MRIALIDELENFDWSNHVGPSTPMFREKPYLLFQAPVNEQPYDRKLRMLEQVRKSCMACSMCELGRQGVCSSRGERILRDPHVFSSMNPTRFVVVGQNPGWNEVVDCQPFVGDAGETFNTELYKHGLDRSWFYITNTVKCHTPQNARPLHSHISCCEPFLKIELTLIRPLLVAALGAVAFDALCPGWSFSDSVGTALVSEVYDAPVFVLHHPSPRNLDSGGKMAEFCAQMKLLCKLVKRMRDDDIKKSR